MVISEENDHLKLIIYNYDIVCSIQKAGRNTSTSTAINTLQQRAAIQPVVEQVCTIQRVYRYQKEMIFYIDFWKSSWCHLNLPSAASQFTQSETGNI